MIRNLTVKSAMTIIYLYSVLTSTQTQIYLTQKIEAAKYIAEVNAAAIRDYKGQWVPQIVYGGGGGKGGTAKYSAAQDMMEAMTVKAFKDLSLDLKVKK